MKKWIKTIGALLLAVAAVKLCAVIAGGTALSIPESFADRIIQMEGFTATADLQNGSAAVTVPEAEETDTPEIIESAAPGFQTAEPTPEPIFPFFLTEENAAPPTIKLEEPHPAPSSDFKYSVPAIDNDTSVAIDAMAMLSELPAITVTQDSPTILILHTHGSEAYYGTEGYRTLDRTKDVVRVGDALTTELQNRGYNVIHDRECYDYPAYNNSYNRSADAAKAWIEQYPAIDIVFDIHRDSLTLPDGTPKATTYSTAGGEKTAQIMIIATNGEKGLTHPNWKENMKFALRLQSAAETLYPGLMRPLLISGQRFNQHLAPGYLLLEVGSTGNTVEEAAAAARLFADSLEQVLSDLQQ